MTNVGKSRPMTNVGKSRPYWWLHLVLKLSTVIGLARMPELLYMSLKSLHNHRIPWVESPEIFFLE
jgi:hypothetical protein